MVLSYSFRQNYFSADRTIVSRSIVLNGQKMTVIGVAQPGFDGVEIGNPAKVLRSHYDEDGDDALSDGLNYRRASGSKASRQATTAARRACRVGGAQQSNTARDTLSAGPRVTLRIFMGKSEDRVGLSGDGGSYSCSKQYTSDAVN